MLNRPKINSNARHQLEGTVKLVRVSDGGSGEVLVGRFSRHQDLLYRTSPPSLPSPKKKKSLTVVTYSEDSVASGSIWQCVWRGVNDQGLTKQK